MDIAIDFNKETFQELAERLINLENYTVIISHLQFKTLKLMYNFKQITINELGFIKQETIPPTTIGTIYGLSYRVEN